MSDEFEQMTYDPDICFGSGKRPAELIILDTIPGMDPSGTCTSCGKFMTLKWWRLPDHEGNHD